MIPIHAACRAARPAAFALIALSLAITPAGAHHPMGGTIPATFLHGLLSGLGHPIIGLDHFAAMLAVGCLCALQPRGALLALGFVAANIAGAALHLRGINLPAGEILAAAAVIALGAVLISARALPAALLLAVFLAAGFVHGYLLGEAIVGAETAPLAAYFIGLVLVQSAVALAAMKAAQFALARGAGGHAALRLAGFAIAAFGLFVLVRQLTSAA